MRGLPLWRSGRSVLLGYRRFRCRECGKQFSECSVGLLNHTQYPSTVVALVVLWRLRYRLTLCNLAEMFRLHGLVFSHEAVCDREAKLTPVLADEFRQRRHGEGSACGRRWHVDETYLRVRSRWAYLYRAVDRSGNLVDTILREYRDMTAAQTFLCSAKSVTDQVPNQAITDGHGCYPRAIRSTLGRRAVHRTSAYKNRLEQDHRGVKGRIRWMHRFKSFDSAERFCRSHDKLRNFIRLQTHHNQHVPANRQRLLHLRRAAVLALIAAAQKELAIQLVTPGLA